MIYNQLGPIFLVLAVIVAQWAIDSVYLPYIILKRTSSQLRASSYLVALFLFMGVKGAADSAKMEEGLALY